MRDNLYNVHGIKKIRVAKRTWKHMRPPTKVTTLTSSYKQVSKHLVSFKEIVEF